MKAWLVQHKEYPESAEIVQAPTRAKAMYHSDAYHDSHEWNKVVAKRAPGFDDKPLNDKTYIENGWGVWCHGPKCERQIEDYDFEYEDDGQQACWDGEWAYCSTACKQAAALKRGKV